MTLTRPLVNALSAFSGSLIAPTLIFAGDSQFADGWQGGGNGTTYWGRTPAWIKAKTHSRFICDLNSNMLATDSLTTTTWISTWLAATVAACQAARAIGSTPVVLLKIGTNDCSASPSYASVRANYETIFNALYAAGAIVCPILILPRAAPSALGTNGELLRNGINSYLTSQRWGSRSIIPIDTIKVMTNGDGTPLTGGLVDGLHTTPIGADLESTVIANALNSLCQYDTLQDFVFAADAYSATYAPNGNHLTNGTLSGTAGTKSNSQATGNVPTSWAAGGFTTVNLSAAGTHMTGAFSSVTSSLDVPNEPMTQIALGGTASNEYIALTQTVNGNGAAGDIVQMGCAVEWDSGLTNVSGIGVYFNMWFQGQAIEGASLDGVNVLPGTSARRLQLVSNQVLLPVGYGNQNVIATLFVQGSSNGVPSGNVRFGQAWHRKLNA